MFLSRDACSAPVIQVSGRVDSFASVSEPVRLMLQHVSARGGVCWFTDRFIGIDRFPRHESSQGWVFDDGRLADACATYRSMQGSVLSFAMYDVYGSDCRCVRIVVCAFGWWWCYVYRLKLLHNGSEVSCVYTVPSAAWSTRYHACDY